MGQNISSGFGGFIETQIDFEYTYLFETAYWWGCS